MSPREKNLNPKKAVLFSQEVKTANYSLIFWISFQIISGVMCRNYSFYFKEKMLSFYQHGKLHLSVHRIQPMFDTQPRLLPRTGDTSLITHMHSSNTVSLWGVWLESSQRKQLFSQVPDRIENTLSSCFVGSYQNFIFINVTTAWVWAAFTTQGV